MTLPQLETELEWTGSQRRDHGRAERMAASLKGLHATVTSMPSLIRNRLRHKARERLHGRLQGLPSGSLVLVEGGQHTSFGPVGDGDGEKNSLNASVIVEDPRFYSRVALGGGMGAGESFAHGEWACDNLVDLFRMLLRSPSVLEPLEKGWTWPNGFWRRIAKEHSYSLPGMRNRPGIQLKMGAPFFRLVLDEALTASCCLFEDEGLDLDSAAVAKYELMAQTLNLSSNDRVLEIGCGWGGFALYAARHYGCQVTATTASPQQLTWAICRACDAGLEDRVTFLANDYMEMAGAFTKVVSMGMVEQVGYWGLTPFLQKCGALLEPDGALLLEAVTVPNHGHLRRACSMGFVKRHILPGTCLHSTAAIHQALKAATDLQVAAQETLTPHYALTIRHWRERFNENLDRFRSMGISDTELGLWEYFLAYAEAGFLESHIGASMLLMVKPHCTFELPWEAASSVSTQPESTQAVMDAALAPVPTG